jgi:Zn-dependent peptidase ImmA (M78 family)
MKIQSDNPIGAAKELHYLIGWTCPADFTIEEIANALGVIVKEVPIKGSEGRILIKGETGIVSVSNAITHYGKKNFVIGHEIGHFILHKNLTSLFSDTHKTLLEWHKKGVHEQQANEFASELLMPEVLFKSKIAGKKLNIGLIEEVSLYFKVSLTATFLKYITLGDYPLMVIFVDDGIIKWKKCSADFPFKFIPYNSSVPAWTVAGDYFNRNVLEAKPVKVNAIEWFPEDFQIKYKQDWKLWEQCYQVSNRGLISCLWTY